MDRKRHPKAAATHSPPAVLRALDYLRPRLESQEWPFGIRLPPIQDLARAAQTAPAAVCQALKILTAENKVTVKRRSGTFAGKLPAVSATPPTHGRFEKRQNLYNQIERAVVDGAYAPGENLPTLAALQQRYVVGYKVLRKILDSLVAAGHLESAGRQFRIPKPRHRRHHASILFIGLGNDLGGLNVLSRKEMEFISGIQAESLSPGVNFVTLGCWEPDFKSSFLDRLRALQSKHSFIGYVLWPESWSSTLLNQVLQALGKYPKPIAIIDLIGEVRSDALFKKHPRITKGRHLRLFTVGGQLAGKKIGQFLKQKGHRHVAYLSPVHGEPWAQERLHGLESECHATPIKVKLDLLALPQREPDYGLDNGEMPDLSQSRQHFESFLESLSALEKRHHLHFLGATMGWEMFRYDRYVRLSKAMTPMIQKLVSQKEITAWIGANDMVALVAKYLLKHLRPGWKHGIDIIGFDNSRDSFDYEISTYDFGFTLLARKVFAFIFNPKAFPLGKSGVLENEGYVIERYPGPFSANH